MKRLCFLSIFICIFQINNSMALTGIADTPIFPIDTVSPIIQDCMVTGINSLTLQFSEPMLMPDMSAAERYEVFGMGTGTLSPFPSHVLGGPQIYLLEWTDGEMRDHVTLMVRSDTARDSVGNPIQVEGNALQIVGKGVSPTFFLESVSPTVASPGDTVEIRFAATESLLGDPEVQINSAAAVMRYSEENVYSFTYQVGSVDETGSARITIAGVDLAGNMGVSIFPDSFTIESADPELPLSSCLGWIIILFMALGVYIIHKRSAGYVLMLVAGIFTFNLGAYAQSPEISNQYMVQSASEDGSTEVEIFFDLNAPNGPCSILLSLSKDGGLDGFSHPVTNYYGDIANVTTGTGKRIVWDVRKDYPEESIPLARIRIKADDGMVLYSLSYTAQTGGILVGESFQQVLHGQGGKEVTAVALEGYNFTGWSDGLETPSRIETNVTGNLSVVALFAPDPVLRYTAGPNGTLAGETLQFPGYGGDGTPVMAHPVAGYHFVNWSDGSTANPRQDINNQVDLNVTAYFSINMYTLTYEVNGLGSISGESVQVVPHGQNGTEVTVIPEPGSYFLQWSDDLLSANRQDMNITSSKTYTAILVTDPSPVIFRYGINDGAVFTNTQMVTLNNTCVLFPDEYMASEDPDFSGAIWFPYDEAPIFQLGGNGIKHTVYLKVRNEYGTSVSALDYIYLAPEMIEVEQSIFTMGRVDYGDDALYGSSSELPRHDVELSPYDIGRYEVTNQQYCDVLNWAYLQGELYRDVDGNSWTGTGMIYTGGEGACYPVLSITSSDCNIRFSNGIFVPKSRLGLPTGTVYSMAEHPVVRVSWYGSIAFCNWLSRMLQLPAVYNVYEENWPLLGVPENSFGFRLPTEAEWERAAAWDTSNGGQHWIYGIQSDTFANKDRGNYRDNNPSYINPLGLTVTPYTSPIGWFNGVNISPNGSINTVNSPNAIGLYDVSGNAWEWCHDWYASNFYGLGNQTNPIGPESGTFRVQRGGGWYYTSSVCRTALRVFNTPNTTSGSIGFRIVKSNLP